MFAIMRRCPIPDHASFEQPIPKEQVGRQFLQGSHFPPQILDPARVRLPGQVAGKPRLPRVQEFLRPVKYRLSAPSIRPIALTPAPSA